MQHAQGERQPEQGQRGSQAGPWTIQRLLEWTRGHFAAKGIEEPRLAAEVLLAAALKCRRIELYARFDRVPDASQLDAFRSLVKQAAEHSPISYLVGTKEFYSLEFEVTPAVLIPRPETELLVQQAIETVRSAGVAEPRLLDLCTGSGCIVVALLKNLPAAIAAATDVSADALAVAERNARTHGVADRVRFVEVDRLALPEDHVPAGGFDVIVCNPPYVAVEDWDSLAPNVRDHEPRAALTDEADGLSFFRALAAGAARLLRPDGRVLVEIANDRAPEVRQVFAEAGGWNEDGVWRDTVGGHERVMRFRRAAGGD
jgi:release factor glutamine methyltransferase